MADLIGVPVLVLALGNPSAPATLVRGTPGTTHYSYVCVGVAEAGHTAASPPALVTTGPLSLSVVNSILITPPNVANVDTWDIYRVSGGTTQGFIGQVVPSILDDVQIASLLDFGLVGDGETAPIHNTSGQLYVDVTGMHNLLMIGVDGQVLPLSVGTEGQIVKIVSGVPTWHAEAGDLGFTPENVVNKSTNSSLGMSNTLYPSQSAVKAYVDTAILGLQPALGFTPEDVSHKSTTSSLGTSDTLYPTQHAVKLYVDGITAGLQPSLATHLTLLKQTTSQPAPGDGIGLLRWEAGTTSGTLKLVAYSGTSTAGITIVDNVGGGNS